MLHPQCWIVNRGAQQIERLWWDRFRGAATFGDLERCALRPGDVHSADGNGSVAQDDAEAMKLYRLTVEQCHADAQSKPGMMYAEGDDVPKE